MGTDQLLEYRGEDKKYPDDAWVAAPVKKGSLVLIHGQVIIQWAPNKLLLTTLVLHSVMCNSLVGTHCIMSSFFNNIHCFLLQVYHKSERNTSEKPRHAYTFHIIETEGSHYASKNWLQPTPQSPLPRLYFHTRK